jgi:predicted amidophosphoribosyltransferase
MRIRFYLLDGDDYGYDCCNMIHAVEYEGNYSEYIKALKVSDHIYVDDLFHKLDSIVFNPARSEEYTDSIDVFVKIP